MECCRERCSVQRVPPPSLLDPSLGHMANASLAFFLSEGYAERRCETPLFVLAPI